MSVPGDFYHYKVYRSTTGLPGSFSVVGITTDTVFVDNNVSYGNTYYYFVSIVTRYLLSDLVTYQESSPSDIFSITYNEPENPDVTEPLPPVIVPPFVSAIGPDPDYGHRIGTYDYRVIVDKISEAYDLGKESLAPLICMYNTLQNTDVNARQRHKTELESYLRRTYAYIIYKHLDNQQSMYKAIRALNDHVIKTYGEAYGYTTIDEFLIDQFLQVPLTYAILSGQVGYTITMVGDSKARFADINILIKDINLPWNKIGWENL